MRVEKDFEEFIRLLNRHKVKYLIVGAYAVTFHAQPRNTGDIDFFIESEKDNAKRLIKAIRDFGFESLNLTEDDFLKPDYVVQLGYEPNRIDLLSSISGIKFDRGYAAKVKGMFGRETTWFISFENLIKNKQTVGRKKDEADVEVLLQFKKSGNKKKQEKL
ncbi:MAG: hypothetical protein HZB54_00225 [Deltaproteobacteria bacterium]|nr:hypothetical protein [Deltaproteobacteria bacterium]